MKVSIKKKNEGLVLIAVLWTVVVLIVMVAVLARKSRLDMKVCAARMDGVRLKWACRAGVEKAVAVLNDDETENDTMLDTWSDNEEDFNDIALENCTFSVRVIDEASKLNINYATKAQLMGLPEMVEEIADAIIDWRDNDDTPSGLGVEGGYYETLDFGYMARNGSFRTIRELLLVKDVTEELFYGEDTNNNGQLDYNERDGDATAPADDGDSELDLGWIAYLTCYTTAEGQSQGTQNQSNQNQSSQSQNNQNQSNQNQSNQNQSNQNQSSQNQNNQNQSSQNQGNQDQSSQNQSNQNNQSQNNQSESNQNQSNQNQGSQNQNQSNQSSSSQAYAKVNINTAPEAVLTALLGGGDEAESTALDIIGYRQSAENGIENISELTEQQILSNDVFSQIQNYITTRSDIFTIYCVAMAGASVVNGATLQTEAVVDRSTKPCKILFRYQGSSN
ncbi:MAG: type II secretion system protein GspK [Planctomycetota bacterium]